MFFCNVIEKSGDDDADEDSERVEGDGVVGLCGELGADSDTGRGQFSSASCRWIMADKQSVASLVVGLELEGALRGW